MHILTKRANRYGRIDPNYRKASLLKILFPFRYPCIVKLLSFFRHLTNWLTFCARVQIHRKQGQLCPWVAIQLNLAI